MGNFLGKKSSSKNKIIRPVTSNPSSSPVSNPSSSKLPQKNTDYKSDAKEIQTLNNNNTIKEAEELLHKFNDTAESFYLKLHIFLFICEKYQARLHETALITHIFNTSRHDLLASDFDQVINAYEKLMNLLSKDNSLEQEILAKKLNLNSDESPKYPSEERKKYFEKILPVFEESKIPEVKFKLCQSDFKKLHQILSSNGLDELTKQTETAVNKNPQIKTNQPNQTNNNSQAMNNHGIYNRPASTSTTASSSTQPNTHHTQYGKR